MPRSLLALIVCAAVGASSCGEPPTREMDQAQGAIDAARAARADRYATEEYQAAVSALQQARDAVAQRDYRLALNHALDSRERAQVAAKQGADQQATLRSAAERRLSELTAMLAQANQRLKEADAATRIPKKALIAPRAAIADADLSLQKSGTELKDGDYVEGQQLLNETAKRLQATTAELDSLLEARPPKASK